jgi:lipid II:glycine glycyltransferase (peptidoglycan interpeptide bridge formation enzyme)
MFTPPGSAFSSACAPCFNRMFTRAAANVQPPDSVLVDLVPGEQTILASMKSKWRYNIGLAEKRGVTVRSVSSVRESAPVGDARVNDRSVTAMATDSDKNVTDRSVTFASSSDLTSYYRIYKETAARDGISIHGLNYYAALFDEAAAYGIDLRLYTASHEGEDIAGIVTLFRGKEAVYLYGASANHKRNLMAPYALQWKAMRDAKSAGCAYYDMFGIPPRPPEDDPHHPMAGLYRFKTGFIGDKGEGGTIIHRPGSWDYNCRPLAKALYTAAEKTRKKIWDLKKRLRKRG